MTTCKILDCEEESVVIDRGEGGTIDQGVCRRHLRERVLEVHGRRMKAQGRYDAGVVWQNRRGQNMTRLEDGGKAVAVDRIVLENKVGRKLISGELVLHLNGDLTDDEVENIVVGLRGVAPQFCPHCGLDWRYGFRPLPDDVAVRRTNMKGRPLR